MDLRPTLDPIDEELNQFDRDIHQLKIEYEQFFGGGKKRPPADIEWRIDVMIKRHGDRGTSMNYQQRFRYSNLLQTYSRYRDIFHKRMRSREEGAVQRHFGAAARAVEAERAAKERKSVAPVAVACFDPSSEPDEGRRNLRRLSRVPGPRQESLSTEMSRAKFRAVYEAQGRRASQGGRKRRS